MRIAQSQDQQADDDLADNEADRSGKVVERGEDHLGQPFVIDPTLITGTIRVGVGLDDRSEAKDVLAEPYVPPEVGVGNGVGKPEQAETDQQA
jgi:hypothetical protein